MKILRWGLPTLIIILLASILYLTFIKEDPAAGPANNISTEDMLAVDDIILTDGNGKKVAFSSFKGKPLLIHLWASWCPVCVTTLPEIDQLSADKTKNFQMVTVVSPGLFREKNEADFKAWYSKLNYPNIVVLYDTEGKLVKMTKTRAFPTNVIVNSDGKIMQVIPGHLPNDQMKSLFQP